MSPMDDRRSERFGRYEILAELGRGAMGIVYKARDPKINRVVAVKTFLLSGQAPEEEKEYRERFFREAEAAGRLSHPGIVTIFDVGEEPETRAPYIVMEFVGGQSLDKFLSEDDHKLPLDTALQLTFELAEALDCAHGQGVVHRDLKPANILITEDGHAKIADFGVAKLNLANQTLGGRALGTPAYMSPEQLNGEVVDGRSDLFSLGVVLYTVLTGYRPFQGNSAMTVSFKVVNREPIPATVLDTQLPQGLDYIIRRAMAKDPAERYQRGMEMALDIQDLREGRELWSTSKKGGLPNVGTPELADGPGRPRIVGKSATAARDKSHKNHLADKLVEKMRSKLLAATFLMVGLLLFGLRMSRFARPQASPPRTQTGTKTVKPLPAAGEIGPVKTEIARSATANDETSSAPTPSRAGLKNPKVVTRTSSSTPKSAHPDATPVPLAISPATLEIEVEHKFAEAHLSIWVDGHLSYTHLLEGTDKKHLVVFHHVQGHEFHAVQIPPGKHLLRVQVSPSSDASNDKSATVTGEFASSTEKLLRVQFDKRGEMNLSLQ
jgi:eukaryotic-like serine/threonine-protein kinase